MIVSFDEINYVDLTIMLTKIKLKSTTHLLPVYINYPLITISVLTPNDFTELTDSDLTLVDWLEIRTRIKKKIPIFVLLVNCSLN